MRFQISLCTFTSEPKPVQTSQWLPPRHLLHANQSNIQSSATARAGEGRTAILLWWSTGKTWFISACEPRFVLCDIWPLYQSWAGSQGNSIVASCLAKLALYHIGSLWSCDAPRLARTAVPGECNEFFDWSTLWPQANVELVSSLAMMQIRAGNTKAWQLWAVVEKT